jgi:hypothetical protein
VSELKIEDRISTADFAAGMRRAQDRLIRLAAALLMTGTPPSEFIDDHPFVPARVPARWTRWMFSRLRASSEERRKWAIELREIADGIGQAITGETEEERASDVLFDAVEAGKTSFAELAEGIGQIITNRITVETKAAGNIAKWGTQNIETLLIAMQEELGEIAQAFLQHKYEGGERVRIFEENDDLAALCVQLHQLKHTTNEHDETTKGRDNGNERTGNDDR